MVKKVSQAVEGGVNMVQVREKNLPGQRLLELAHELRGVVGDKVLLIINERLDIALAGGADGVHLGEEGLVTSAVHNVSGRDMIIGRSVHSVDGALGAQRDGANYVIAGTIFPTRSHSGGRHTGAEFLVKLGATIAIPYLGIGGINANNAKEVMDAGAAGVAVISAILGSDAPLEAAQDIRGVLDEALRSRKL